MPGPIVPYPVTQGPVYQSGAYQQCLPPPALQDWVQCFWQLSIPSGHYGYTSLPDNCVDWIISCQHAQDSFLLSPFTQAQAFSMHGPTSYFGIRFLPLGLGALSPIALGEWADTASIASGSLVGEPFALRLFEALQQASEFKPRCALISQLLQSKLKEVEVDRRLQRFMAYCRSQYGAMDNLNDTQCREFGLSARQLRRLSHLNLGLSPKAFARVWRFQYHLQQLHTQPGLWLQHFHDQAHFIREFKTMSGASPSQFGKLSVLYKLPD